MVLKVVNETKDGTVELIEFSPTSKDCSLIEKIVDDACILRPLDSTDSEGNYLWDYDIVEFEYENSKYIGFIKYEQCMWLWVNVKKIGNKYTDPALFLKKRFNTFVQSAGIQQQWMKNYLMKSLMKKVIFNVIIAWNL